MKILVEGSIKINNVWFSRYSRHIRLLGEEGQKKINNSTVAVIGCGALGSVSAEILARSGVGRLILVDRDIVELSNLQRQFVFTEKDVEDEIPKAVALKRYLQQINSDVELQSHVISFNGRTGSKIISESDIIVDATDNFETRYILNELCYIHDKPFVYGGVVAYYGVYSFLQPGKDSPCFNCIFPTPPSEGELPTCESAGILSSLPATVASLQCAEALKYIADRGDILKNYLIYISLNPVKFDKIRIQRDSSCKLCGRNELYWTERENQKKITQMCGNNTFQYIPDEEKDYDMSSLVKTLEDNECRIISKNSYLINLLYRKYKIRIFRNGRIIIQNAESPDEIEMVVGNILR